MKPTVNQSDRGAAATMAGVSLLIVVALALSGGGSGSVIPMLAASAATAQHVEGLPGRMVQREDSREQKSRPPVRGDAGVAGRGLRAPETAEAVWAGFAFCGVNSPAERAREGLVGLPPPGAWARG